MSKKRTYQEIYDYFKSQGCELLSTEYINAHQKLQYKCPNGHIHEMTWNNFQRGKRCPKCRDEKLREQRRHDESIVIKAFEDEGYKVKSKYYNARTPVKYICPNGHENECSYDNWMKGNRCPECCRNVWSIEKAREYLQQFDYELLEEEYVNSSKLMKMKCPKGHIIFKSLSNFYAGHRCPCCNEYKSMKEIENILNKYNIDNLREYRFNDCRNIKPLPFDFYLPDYNTCIEYDGEQHYKALDFYGIGKEEAKKRFEEGKERDRIKDQYCKNNGIKLIRIPYWEFKNSEEIIKKELNIL